MLSEPVTLGSRPPSPGSSINWNPQYWYASICLGCNIVRVCTFLINGICSSMPQLIDLRSVLSSFQIVIWPRSATFYWKNRTDGTVYVDATVTHDSVAEQLCLATCKLRNLPCWFWHMLEARGPILPVSVVPVVLFFSSLPPCSVLISKVVVTLLMLLSFCVKYIIVFILIACLLTYIILMPWN